MSKAINNSTSVKASDDSSTSAAVSPSNVRLSESFTTTSRRRSLRNNVARRRNNHRRHNERRQARRSQTGYNAIVTASARTTLPLSTRETCVPVLATNPITRSTAPSRANSRNPRRSHYHNERGGEDDRQGTLTSIRSRKHRSNHRSSRIQQNSEGQRTTASAKTKKRKEQRRKAAAKKKQMTMKQQQPLLKEMRASVNQPIKKESARQPLEIMSPTIMQTELNDRLEKLTKAFEIRRSTYRATRQLEENERRRRMYAMEEAQLLAIQERKRRVQIAIDLAEAERRERTVKVHETRKSIRKRVKKKSAKAWRACASAASKVVSCLRRR